MEVTHNILFSALRVLLVHSIHVNKIALTCGLFQYFVSRPGLNLFFVFKILKVNVM